MPLDGRDYIRGNHPPTCTCVDCCEKRLKQLKNEVHPDYVSYCPKCGQKSLWHNVREQKYECLNLKCKFVGSSPQEVKISNNGIKDDANQTHGIAKPLMPKWLKALLLIFCLSFVGLVINVLIGNVIPFWILFGFSVIFSIEKWFSYEARTHKLFDKLYRLILNLAILSLLGLVIWSGVRLFSHQFVHSALVGSILFVGELAFFIWAWTVVAKNSWRWPSMKLTIFTLICLFLVFSFAGVQPMSLYKDTTLSKIRSTFSNENNNQSVSTFSNNDVTTSLAAAALATTIAHTNAITTPSQTTSIVQSIAKGINSKTGVYNNYYLGLVYSSGSVIAGDGCYDDSSNFIVLINNKNAIDPTYAQLLNFLQSDKTDQYPYTYTNRLLNSYYGTAESHVDLKNVQNIIDGNKQPSNPDVCADFAERLHNDAEMAGIRCAYVSIDISGYTDPYHYGISSNTSHALDAFQTIDRGLVYIDDTNAPGPTRSVKTVNVAVGQAYIPVSLFPESGWNSTWGNMGTVTDMQVTWDGTWN